MLIHDFFKKSDMSTRGGNREIAVGGNEVVFKMSLGREEVCENKQHILQLYFRGFSVDGSVTEYMAEAPKNHATATHQ